MSNKVECWVCGKEHDYCPTCGQTHGWRYVADTIEHYQIHMTIEEYRSGVLTKEQAIEVFADKCGVHANDDLSWMLPHVEKVVREIIGEKARERTTKTTRKNKLY
jgi:hypothetical protein